MDKKFSIEQHPFGKFTEYRLINLIDNSYTSIIPEYGANLNQICLHANNRLHELLLGSPTYESMITEGLKKNKGCKLIPFPNRLNHGKYEFNGKQYTLPINEPERANAIHGLVRDKPFKVLSTEAGDDSAKLTVSYDCDGSNEGYPFKYSVLAIFELNLEGFKCTTALKSTDDKDLLIGEGVHPYFRTGSPVDTLFIKLPKGPVLDTDERLIPNSKSSVFDKFEESRELGDQKLDNCFVLDNLQDKVATVEIVDKEVGIKLSYWQEIGENKYNYLQVFTAVERDCIALEPMTCAPDAFNNKMGLIVLKPGATVEFSWGVKLSSVSE